MKQYRIGRIQEPWTNMEPPIRSPDYYEKRARSRSTAKADYNPQDESKKQSSSRASVDLSSVRLLYNHTMLSRGCLVSVR